ncbi:MAG: phospholipid carrier-dependent glycosyltransferase [Candidatus Shapirobacteria bacterium]
MTVIKKILLILVFATGLTVRLYKINNPIADWHSFRQADTASVTRNFLRSFDLLRPTYHDLSNLQSGKDNPHGYRFVEFPIYNAVSVVFYKAVSPLFPSLTVEVASRLISIFFSLITGFLIFLIGLQITKNFWPSFLATTTFLFLPFSIYYSRTILPEPTAVLFMMLTLYLFPKSRLLSGISLALAILTKPFTGIIIFPLLFFYSLRLNLFKPKTLLSLFFFALISLLPFYLWRQWISQFPEGIPASNWLFNEGGLRFRPAWFRWLFFERIGKLILGIYGVIPLLLGFAYKKNHSQLFCLLASAGILLYFSIIARGNIQHDYYQFLITPLLSLIIGFGLYYLYQFVFDQKLIALLVTFSVFAAALFYSWFQVQEYYKINNPVIMEAGKMVDQLIPKNSLVVAPYNGDTAFLYQTNRSGFPIEIYDFPKFFSLYKNYPIYYVSTTYNGYTNELISKYPTIFRSDKFIILYLHEPNQN